MAQKLESKRTAGRRGRGSASLCLTLGARSGPRSVRRVVARSVAWPRPWAPWRFPSPWAQRTRHVFLLLIRAGTGRQSGTSTTLGRRQGPAASRGRRGRRPPQGPGDAGAAPSVASRTHVAPSFEARQPLARRGPGPEAALRSTPRRLRAPAAPSPWILHPAALGAKPWARGCHWPRVCLGACRTLPCGIPGAFSRACQLFGRPGYGPLVRSDHGDGRGLQAKGPQAPHLWTRLPSGPWEAELKGPRGVRPVSMHEEALMAPWGPRDGLPSTGARCPCPPSPTCGLSEPGAACDSGPACTWGTGSGF